MARPLVHLAWSYWQDESNLSPLPEGLIDDQSRLNASRVRQVWPVPGSDPAAEQQLRQLLVQARQQGLPVSIAGARHSMGGHSIAPDGIVIDMRRFNAMSLSDDGQILRVQAGALWSEVLPFLDQYGRSVSIMQSDSRFSVGGSLSVNVHGWQSLKPPIIASVKSIRLMLADGTILHCSRSQHAELFSAVIGGYGLLGIILDAELQTQPNAWYQVERVAVDASQIPELFSQYLDSNPSLELAYGRLRVTPDALLQQGILTFYRRVERAGLLPAPVESTGLDGFKRAIFRGSIGSDYGKSLRWELESWWGESFGQTFQSRNQLLNSDPAFYLNRSAAQTDILHEYFIPPAQLTAFLARARALLQQYPADLLNLTLRDVRQDRQSLLRYATQDYLALVMFFNQPRTEAAERQMQQLTQALIAASLELGGRYYLPYRPHASLQQFVQAYPQALDFVRLKRQYDPMGRFQNQFYQRYLAPLSVEPGL